MSQYPWISAEATHPITGEDEGMATGGKEEDLLPEEMYLPQDMEAPPDVSIVEKKDITHATAPKRNSYPTMRETTDKPTSLTCKTKKNRTTAMIIKMHDIQETDSVASVCAQLESMPLEDQMHLAKEMGVSQDFPSA